MSKLRAYYNEFFSEKTPVQLFKENNSSDLNPEEHLFENFHENKEWFIYEGANTITVVFTDNSRQTFKVHFLDTRGEDRAKHRTKAARTWKKLASEIHKDTKLSKAGNPIVTPWPECFQQALQKPEMREFVDDLSAKPIFEGITENYGAYELWLSPNGEPLKGASHYSIGFEYLRKIGTKFSSPREVYDTMYRLGFARVVVGDSQYPLLVDKGKEGVQPNLSRSQRDWVENKSFELGLTGSYNEKEVGALEEMTYDDLRNSMKKYRVRRGGNGNTVQVGDNGREKRAEHVRVKPLRVVSTVGKDKKDRDTSLFSYRSEAAWGDPGDRYQGYIRFLSNDNTNPEKPVAPSFEEQAGGDVEVNCTCPDYRYVWAKPNADAGAGSTSRDGKIDVHEAPVFPQSGPVGQAAPAKGMTGYGQFKGGGNDNKPGLDKGIRNPANVPGLCKHLIALAEYLDTKIEPTPVAPAGGGPEKPSSVAPSKLKHTGKPVNIFETMKRFAMANPQFTVQYEDKST